MRQALRSTPKGSAYHDQYRDKTVMVIVDQQSSTPEALRTIAEHIAAMRQWGLKAIQLTNIPFAELGDSETSTMRIAEDRRDELAEVFIVLGQEFLAQDGRKLSLLCAADIENRIGNISDETRSSLLRLLPFVRSIGKVAIVQPGDLLAEIENVRGKGLLLIDERQLQCSSLTGVTRPLFDLVYEQHTTGESPPWRKRSPEELEQLASAHCLVSIKDIPLGGWSNLPRGKDASDQVWWEVSALWTSDPSDRENGFQSGGMGPRILDHAQRIAQVHRVALYALTSQGLADKLFLPTGFSSRGNLAALQRSGGTWTDHLRSYNEERAEGRTLVTWTCPNDK